MNTFHGSIRDHLAEVQKAVLLLSATCKGNDPELPPCPLFHGSLGPMLFSDIDGEEDYTFCFHREVASQVKLQSLLINSHNITWSKHVYFPKDEVICRKICDTLSKTRYSSRSIKSIRVHPATLTISVPFIKSHCQAAEEFRGIVDHQAKLYDSTSELLSQLTFIKELRLPRCNITDEGLRHLSNLSSLRYLDLRECSSITDDGLMHLWTNKSSAGLQYLDVSDCRQLTRIGLIHASNLSALRHLHLSSKAISHVSDVDIFHLTKLSHLESLGAEYFDRITDTSLRHLSKITSLRNLHLSFCDIITDEGLRHLAKLPSLQRLDVGHCHHVTDTGLLYLAEQLSTSLQHLDLDTCYEITDDGLFHLSKLFSLEFLDLGCIAGITDAGLQHLSKLPSLRSLRLVYCGQVTDVGLQHLLALPSLTCSDELDVTGTAITDEGFEAFEKQKFKK